MGGQRRVVGRNCSRLCIIKLRCLKHSGECAAVPEVERGWRMVGGGGGRRRMTLSKVHYLFLPHWIKRLGRDAPKLRHSRMKPRYHLLPRCVPLSRGEKYVPAISLYFVSRTQLSSNCREKYRRRSTARIEFAA